MFGEMMKYSSPKPFHYMYYMYVQVHVHTYVLLLTSRTAVFSVAILSTPVLG